MLIMLWFKNSHVVIILISTNDVIQSYAQDMSSLDSRIESLLV